MDSPGCMRLTCSHAARTKRRAYDLMDSGPLSTRIVASNLRFCSSASRPRPVAVVFLGRPTSLAALTDAHTMRRVHLAHEGLLLVEAQCFFVTTPDESLVRFSALCTSDRLACMRSTWPFSASSSFMRLTRWHSCRCTSTSSFQL